MSLFDHDDYRAFLRAHLKQLPKRGRGELSRMASALGTNSTLMSQVLGGGRDFNSEQTYSLKPLPGAYGSGARVLFPARAKRTGRKP